MYYLTIIRPDGGRTYSKQAATPNLEVLKKGIGGGLIEIAPNFDRFGRETCVAFCDEEGKLKDLPPNIAATYAWFACLAPEPFRPDMLHGNVVIVTADTEQELEQL